jgi:hypothetical protein
VCACVRACVCVCARASERESERANEVTTPLRRSTRLVMSSRGRVGEVVRVLPCSHFVGHPVAQPCEGDQSRTESANACRVLGGHERKCVCVCWFQRHASIAPMPRTLSIKQSHWSSNGQRVEVGGRKAARVTCRLPQPEAMSAANVPHIRPTEREAHTHTPHHTAPGIALP